MDVVGTYDGVAIFSFFEAGCILLTALAGIYSQFSVPRLQKILPYKLAYVFPFLCRYNDLRLRIFSKYPDLFPEEVVGQYFLTAILYVKLD